MSTYRSCLIALALFVAVLRPDAAVGQDLHGGAAKIEITPPIGFPMWGYAARKDAPSKGVRDPLFVRAVVLQVGKTKTAIAALDLGRAPHRGSRKAIGDAVKAIGIEHFFLVASHTHHGPVIETEDWPDAKKPFVRVLEEKIIRAILEADKALTPARLGVVSSQEKFNRNRHSRRPDRPVDGEVIVVRLDAVDADKPLATLVNFAAHPTMLPAKLHEFSPDFPAFLAAHVEKERGGICLFLQGACGDLSPETSHGRTPEDFGKKLAEKVLDMNKAAKTEGTFATGFQAVRREFTFRSRVDLDNPLIRAAYSLAFYPELVSFYEREYRGGIRPEMTVALLDGRIGFVGVSGEFFSGHALSLKKRARLEHLLFLGCCNDYHQYFPTIEASAEGGYGADELVSPVETGAGERMMNEALMELYRMRGKLAPPVAK